MLENEYGHFFKGPVANKFDDNSYINVADNVEDAIKALSIEKGDRHPERRIKGAFKKYTEENQDRLAEEYGKLTKR